MLSGLDPGVPAAGAALSSASHPFSWPLCTLGDVPVGLEAAPRASNGGFLSPHCSSLPARFGGVHHFLLQAEPSQQVVRIINQLIVHIQKHEYAELDSVFRRISFIDLGGVRTIFNQHRVQAKLPL